MAHNNLCGILGHLFAKVEVSFVYSVSVIWLDHGFMVRQSLSIEIPLVGNIVLIDTEVIVMAKCFEAFFTTWNTSADHQVV